jgi:hypothetical protein
MLLTMALSIPSTKLNPSAGYGGAKFELEA